MKLCLGEKIKSTTISEPGSNSKKLRNSLTVSLEAESVVALPRSSERSSNNSIGTVSGLAKTTSLASGTGESAAFAVFVDRVDDPVDARIVADLLVGRINHDDFIVFHSSVLVDPVRVQNTQVAVAASSLLFGHRLKVTFELELVDTLVLWLTKDHTTVILSLASSTSDTGTDNNESLLGLVSQTVSLLGTGRSVACQNVGTLTVFPSTDTHQESEGIRLLVAPKLFHILVCTHFSWCEFGETTNLNGANRRC